MAHHKAEASHKDVFEAIVNTTPNNMFNAPDIIDTFIYDNDIHNNETGQFGQSHTDAIPYDRKL